MELPILTQQTNSAERKGYSIKEGTGPVDRTVLFEEFTSEGYNECAIADEVYTDILGTRDDVIRVKHHLDYKQQKDQFKIDADKEYEQLYGNSKPSFQRSPLTVLL